MLTTERKAHLLQVLKSQGRIVARELSEQLALSEDTIRRDLRELASEGLLQRVHGGALPASPAIADFARRQQISTAGKTAIARAAAAMISPGQVVFIDGGTTCVQLARALPAALQATVVTHSPSVAVELVGHPEVQVELIGGRLFKHSVVAAGAAALEAIGRVRPDLFFLGVTGAHVDAGLTTGDAEDAALKRAILGQSAETVVLASTEKLGAASPFLIAPISEASSLVVEADAPAAALQPFIDAGVSLVKAR